jgi:hypothetical protein
MWMGSAPQLSSFGVTELMTFSSRSVIDGVLKTRPA